MPRIFLKLISIVFLTSCSDNEEVKNTEIITDSYFFQKKVFNMNLYNCNKLVENVDLTYKKTSDSLNFYKFSELTEQDDQIDGCIQTYTQIKFHKSHKKLATVTAVRPQARFGELEIVDDCVKSFKEKPQLDQGWINGGFFVIEPKFFKYLKNDQSYLERDPFEKLTKKKELSITIIGLKIHVIYTEFNSFFVRWNCFF